MSCREIPIEEIRFDDETFRISEEVFSASLIDSMREIGQLNPVVLLRRDSSFVVVCGFRRVRALRELNAAGVSARVIEAQGADLKDLFNVALRDNLSHRQLEPLEKARAVFKLSSDFGVPDEILVRTYLPRLGLPAHAQALRAQMMLHESAPDIRRHFKEGRLTQASLERLAEMPPESREAIASSVQGMRLSASLQRKFFGLLQDLAAMTDAKPEEPLRDPQVHAVLNNDRLSPGERGERVYAVLYRLRYPRVSHAEERFLEKKKSLGLPGAVRIAADPYFETPDIHVEFKARDAESFRKRVEELYVASRGPELDRLFETDEEIEN